MVPRGYLALFADDCGLVRTHFVDSDRGPCDLPITEVGVRSALYLASPDEDGVRGRQLETLFAKVESAALPLLRDLERRWPIDDHEHRATIAEYLAIQFLRTPAWMESLDRNYRRWAADYELPSELTPELQSRLRSYAALPEQQFEASMYMRPTIGTALASMRWTLLRTSAPIIASSDQPLSVIAFASSTPSGPLIASGLQSVEEVRFPLSRDRALLLDWLPALDAPRPISIPREVARAINFTTVRQADIQWFHLPKREPPRASPVLRTVSPVITPGYTSAKAHESERRIRAFEELDRITSEPFPRTEIRVLHPVRNT